MNKLSQIQIQIIKIDINKIIIIMKDLTVAHKIIIITIIIINKKISIMIEYNPQMTITTMIITIKGENNIIITIIKMIIDKIIINKLITMKIQIKIEAGRILLN